jgi:hypothetical protein
MVLNTAGLEIVNDRAAPHERQEIVNVRAAPHERQSLKCLTGIGRWGPRWGLTGRLTVGHGVSLLVSSDSQ